MRKQYDFKEEWEKTKKQLSGISKGTMKLANKGKLHMDVAALNLKKEHLYHLIGKEYVSLTNPIVPSEKLNEYLREFRKVEKEQQALKHLLESGAATSSEVGK